MEKEKLQLIPKAESYIQYELEMLVKIPRTEKFSIGTEYKQSLYKMMENIMYINKINAIQKYISKNNIELENVIKLNSIDTIINTQRIYLRIMYKNKWIDEKKFNVSMDKIYEIGKIIGGLIKYNAKENKKCMG